MARPLQGNELFARWQESQQTDFCNIFNPNLNEQMRGGLFDLLGFDGGGMLSSDEIVQMRPAPTP